LKENSSHWINLENSVTIVEKFYNKKEAQVWEEYHIFDHFNKYEGDAMLNRKEEFCDKVTFKLYNSLD